MTCTSNGGRSRTFDRLTEGRIYWVSPSTGEVVWQATPAGPLAYNLMEGYPQIDYSDAGDTAIEQYLMPAVQVADFRREAMPPPQLVNNRWVVPERRTMPGIGGAKTNLFTQQISVRPHTGQQAGDPYLFDVARLQLGTHEDDYDPHYVVEIRYSTTRNDQTVRSVQVGAEFLSLNPNKTKLADSASNAGRTRQVTGPSGGDTIVQRWNGTEYEDVDVDNNCDQLMPITKTIPTIIWNVRLPYFVDPDWELITRMLGKVNDTPAEEFNPNNENNNVYDFIENPYPETAMFMGVQGQQNFTWDTLGNRRLKPWDLTFVFSVKRVEETVVLPSSADPTRQGDDTIVKIYGHNHAWSPCKQKWVRLYRGGASAEDPAGRFLNLHEYDTAVHRDGFAALFRSKELPEGEDTE